MSDLIYELCGSNANCFINDKSVVEGHHIDEIYTCLDCVENGVRKAERERIIKLLEPLGECEPSICGMGCRGQHRCIGWAYRHAVALIKGENK